MTTGGGDMRQVEGEALKLLSKQAMIDVAHLLRPAHLQQFVSARGFRPSNSYV